MLQLSRAAEGTASWLDIIEVIESQLLGPFGWWCNVEVKYDLAIQTGKSNGFAQFHVSLHAW